MKIEINKLGERSNVRRLESEQKIEVVGKDLRKMMSWIKNK